MVWHGDHSREIRRGDDSVLRSCRTYAIHPRATVTAPRDREGRARDLLGVKRVRAFVRVVMARERTGQRLGAEFVAEAVLVVRPVRGVRYAHGGAG